MWIIDGKAPSTGSKACESQPRKPQMKCVVPGPLPPAVTTAGSLPAAISRKNATESTSRASVVAGSGSARKYASPCGTTSTSPASSRTGAVPSTPAQQEPRVTTWYETRRCDAGRTAGAKVFARGARVDQGARASTRKNIDPVNLTERSTSDRMSSSSTGPGLAAADSGRPGFVEARDAVPCDPEDRSWSLFMTRSIIPRRGPATMPSTGIPGPPREDDHDRLDDGYRERRADRAGRTGSGRDLRTILRPGALRPVDAADARRSRRHRGSGAHPRCRLRHRGARARGRGATG